MTDPTDHLAEAKRLLATIEARLSGPLHRAAVHAPIAISDALTAADRYAVNEAKQREQAEPDPLDEDDHREAPVISYEDIRQGMTIEATYSNGTRLRFVASRGYSTDSWADPSGCFQITPPGTEGLDPERVIRLIAPPAQAGMDAPEPDPLDESDHRDRLDAGGTRWTRAADGCWANGAHHVLELISLPGPLTFAPGTAQEAAGDDLSASEGESGSVERGEADDAPEALLCPECGHDLEDHCEYCCGCPRSPSGVAYTLLADAVKAEREAGTDG